MNIVFTQTFDVVFNKKFGIRPRHVKSVVNKPDQQIPVTFFEDLEIVFYCKKIESGKTPFYLLVHGHIKDNDLIIDSAWRIYPDIHPDIEHLNPLQMLHLFTQTYGLELTIAETTDRLHFKQEFIVSDISEAQIMQIHNPNNVPCMASTFFKVKNVTEEKKYSVL